jgi:hypothetical protein
MHYSMQRPLEPNAAAVFDATMKMLAEDGGMEADRKRLVDFCCAPGAPVTIAGRARKKEKAG